MESYLSIAEMASANRRYALGISLKLRSLKAQQHLLLVAVRGFIDRIIAAEESWTAGDSLLEYEELCHLLDSAVEFLREKWKDVSGKVSDRVLNCQ
ncbi:hypothetical protein BsWGS_17337 [Bradybaena similaris]